MMRRRSTRIQKRINNIIVFMILNNGMDCEGTILYRVLYSGEIVDGAMKRTSRYEGRADE